MSDINTARSSFDHAGFEKFMNASSDSLSDPSSPRKKPGRRVRAAGGGSKKRAAGGKRAKAEEKPWWDQGGGGGGGFDVNSSGGSSEVAQLGTGKSFLRQTRETPQGRAPRLDDTLQQSGVASIGRVEDSDDFALEAEEDPQQRLRRAPAATDDDELRLQLTRSSLGDSETPAAPPMRGYAGNSRDADDLTTMDTESAAAADPSTGGLAGFKGKPSMLSKVSLLESLDSSSQQLQQQQTSAAQQPQEQHHGDTLHSQTDISAVRDAYKRRLDTLEESTDQRHSKATTGFFASGLNSLPSDQIPEPGQQQQQQQQSGTVGGAMTATAPSATQSFGMQVIRPTNKTEQKEMSIDDLLAEHDEVLTARPDSQRHPQLTPSPPPSPQQQQQQQPQAAQRRHRQAAFDETKIVANPKVVRPPRAPAAAAAAGDAPKRPQKQQQKPAAGKTKQPAGPPPQSLKFGHEELLAGYQKENERLYAELKSAKASGKGLADALSGQKLQLEQELREAREQLERRRCSSAPACRNNRDPRPARCPTPAPCCSSRSAAPQLEAELRACRRRLDEALAESSSCQRNRLELQQQLDRLTRRTAGRRRSADRGQAKLREQSAAIAELRDRLEASEKQRLELLNRRRKRQAARRLTAATSKTMMAAAPLPALKTSTTRAHM
uniref:Centrosomal protein of 162 kDa n=1 Tax=Macrostomum lignano TaxID=282301 RepID=A0A1I8HBS8_9PLAT